MAIAQLLATPLAPRVSPRIVYRGGRRVICVNGQLDASVAGELSAALAQVMRLDQRDLVVDLAGVEFMDTSTVRALLRARTFLSSHGRALRIQSPSAPAARVLRLCNVEFDLAADADRGPELRAVRSDVRQ